MLWTNSQSALSTSFSDYDMYKPQEPYRPCATFAQPQLNLNVAPSEQQSGLDLPLNDMATLRYFFNIGVQQQQQLVKQQLPPAAPAVAPAAPAASAAEQQLQPFRAALQTQYLHLQQALSAATAATAPPPVNADNLLLARMEIHKAAAQKNLKQQLSTTLQYEQILNDACQQLHLQPAVTTMSQVVRRRPAATVPNTMHMTPAATVANTVPSYLQQPIREPAPAIAIVRPTPKRPDVIALSPTSPSTSAAYFAPCPQLQQAESAFSPLSTANPMGRRSSTSQEASDSRRSSRKSSAEILEEGPGLMVAYLNECLGKAKRALELKGAPIEKIDARGMLVDFSSRPIDPIFRVAIEQLQHERYDFTASPKRSRDESCSPREKRARLATM